MHPDFDPEQKSFFVWAWRRATGALDRRRLSDGHVDGVFVYVSKIMEAHACVYVYECMFSQYALPAPAVRQMPYDDVDRSDVWLYALRV